MLPRKILSWGVLALLTAALSPAPGSAAGRRCGCGEPAADVATALGAGGRATLGAEIEAR
jgi:hypothetical protein